MLSLDDLARLAASGEVDTVVTGFTDHHGRLCGQAVHGRLLPRARGRRGHPRVRLPAHHRPGDGAGARVPVRGLGPRLRRRPPRPRPRHAARGRLARPQRAGALRRPPPEHPRPHHASRRAPCCAARSARLADLGFTAMAATELEHFLFRTSYRDAARVGPPRPRAGRLVPRGLPAPAGRAHRGLPRRRPPAPRRAPACPVESSKGEWGLGQHEVNVRYAEVLETADRHTVFKQCLKETADRQGVSVTFMAKPHADRAGSSCHVHLSLWRDGAERLRRRPRPRGRPGTRLAGAALVPRRLPPLGARAGRAARPHRELLQALRRRVVGADPGRLELRQPHRRVPRWWATTRACASSAASPGPTATRTSPSPPSWRPGSAGIEQQVEPPPPSSATPTAPRRSPRSPAPCATPPTPSRPASSPSARFGADVVEHYTQVFRTEQAAYDAAVTDWERQRYFERI